MIIENELTDEEIDGNWELPIDINEQTDTKDSIISAIEYDDNSVTIYINSDASIQSIELIDILGKHCHTFSESTSVLTIDKSAFSDGVYILIIKTTKGIFKRRIIL